MPSGRRRKRQDAFAGIPEEILQEILVRLPAKSVLRCRAVCREWRRLTSDPGFLVAHHHHQPTLHLISSFRKTGNTDYPSLDALDIRRAERRQNFWPAITRCRASCDGLVIIDGSYIVNPATRQVVRLSTDVSNLVGLYHHQPSGEYRVLFWRPSGLPSEVYCENEFCVLTVGSSKPRRRVTCSITPVDEELISGMGPVIQNAPAPLNGNLHVHWRKRGNLVIGVPETRYHRILVFDTVTESFRQMRPPAVSPRHIMQLFDMSGVLVASCSKDTMTELRIFGLQDYKSEVSSFQYRIKLPVMEIRGL